MLDKTRDETAETEAYPLPPWQLQPPDEALGRADDADDEHEPEEVQESVGELAELERDERITLIIPASAPRRRQLPSASEATVMPSARRRRAVIRALPVWALVLSLLLAVCNVSVLAARGDLGALGVPWRAIAGAVGWVPTATPRVGNPPAVAMTAPWPTWNAACNRPFPPPPPSYGYPQWAPPPPTLPVVPKQTIRQMIVSVFGACSHDALVVAHCESNFDNDAWNPKPVLSSHAAGVFQILWRATWNRSVYENDNAFDARANIETAYAVFSYDANSWFEWATASCLPGGCSWCPGTEPS